MMHHAQLFLARRIGTACLHVLVAVLALGLSSGCGHSSTSSRIRKLARQETQLRSSVDTLMTRQRELRVDIDRAEAQAAAARCHAEQEGYRAVVATVFSEYSAAVAERKGCEARAAKDGGFVMAAGCGIAAVLSGGWALALCGGSLLAGAAVSGGCDAAPKPMTEQDIRRIAHQRTGHADLPRCDDPTLATARHRRSEGFVFAPVRPGRPSPKVSVQGGNGLFQAPTRKDTRRYRAEQRKQARRDRADRRVAEKEDRRAAKHQRRAARTRTKALERARREFRRRR